MLEKSRFQRALKDVMRLGRGHFVDRSPQHPLSDTLPTIFLAKKYNMPWIQISITTNSQQCETVESVLLEQGAVSVTLADAVDTPIYEPQPGETPLWPNTTVTALFEPDQHNQHQLTKIIKQQIAHLPHQAFNCTMLADQNWQRAWLSEFKPMQFADNLWICPSAYTPPDPKAVNIFLDPGLAFGTGTHPTTALCLQWLAKQKLKGKTIIDYGCGSGILAIAAVKLGAKSAWCVDNDMQALVATRDNIERNGLSLEQLHTVLPEDMPAIKADLLIANILAKPLLSLMPTFQDLLKHKAPIGLSGILHSQKDQIIHHYQPHFSINTIEQQEEWCLLSGQRSKLA